MAITSQTIDLHQVSRLGFVPVTVDPTLDLVAEINQLKKQKNAVILAHYYQDSEIQEVADYIGDSLGLAQQAAKTPADIIVFAGVHFMAETAKILNPHKKVVLPDLNAGCSLSDSCPAPLFKAFKEKHPDHLVITYINCTAAMKALSDVICTSSNAVAIVNAFPKDQPLIFAPDKNLGAYVSKKAGRDLVLWNGACMVHEIFSYRKIQEVIGKYPAAQLIAHPECEAPVLELAHFIGSTTALLKYAVESDQQQFIVATEPGILHQMRKKAPHKRFIPAPSNQACACNNCPHMKLNTLEKLYNCLYFELPQIEIPEPVLSQALRPIQKMLEISEKLGIGK
jgi:quinolinate synthase